MSSKLEWSFSALSTLRKCNRMYYFQYLAPSHHFANPFRRKAHELKKSKNLLMWRGSIIDKIMEIEIMPLIKEKKEIDFNQVANNAIKLAKRQFKFSQEKLYRIKENSESNIGADYCILDIHETNAPYTEEQLNNVYKSVQEIILGIPEIKMPNGDSLLSYLKKASFIAPNLRGWSFEFENIRISPQIDLFMFVQNKAVVLDWKVSESAVGDYSRQLVMGGITVMDTYRKKAEAGTAKRLGFPDIQLLEINLFKKTAIEHKFNKDVVNECVDYIYINSDDIQLLTENKPFDQLSIEDFPITDKEGTCIFCKFRPLCVHILTNKNQYDEKAYNNSFQDQQLA
jgi:hypothetical protein